MREFEYEIQDEMGIHARPAGVLVRACSAYQSSIQVLFKDKTGDAKKVFSVLSLGVRHGETIRLKIEGPDEVSAEEDLKKFLTDNSY